jgi:hypothetical protein
MATVSNKGAINNADAKNNAKATDNNAVVVANNPAEQTKPKVKYEFNQVLSDGVRALHELMNTDANPMTLDEVMHKVITNAFVTAYDSKVAAKHKTGYKYNASEFRARGLSEEDFVRSKLKPTVDEMREKLLKQRVK